MRSCSEATYKRAEQTGRPCLLGDIGKCAAPCVKRIDPESHRAIADDFVSFMAGNDSRYLRRLERNMRDAAATFEYEAAARYRDQIGALENVLEKSAVVLRDKVDADVFGVAHDELAAAVQQFIVRSEEHTSELQSRQYLVCRLLLEKKKTTDPERTTTS